MADSLQLECPLVAYSVEKLRITMIRKFKGIFHSPGARITDQLCRSELHQARFSYDFCYPLVHTVRNTVQIANKIATDFKTEFFNRIGHKRTFKQQPKGPSIQPIYQSCLTTVEPPSISDLLRGESPAALPVIPDRANLARNTLSLAPSLQQRGGT